MHLKHKKMVLVNIIATWFGSGLSPVAPGTAGSLAALPFAYIIILIGGIKLLLISSILIFLLGWYASEVIVKTEGTQDPGKIVIDEVVGQWLTIIPVALNPILYIVAFFAFRLADILKPFPANWADKNIKGGLGIMIDDCIAAIYSGIFMLILSMSF